ncbi:MAG: GIY-YIG nuclease family protein [Clostridia bacterium]|nr:GIY-YIG nuclease family protein [Clostridia bacterium]
MYYVYILTNKSNKVLYTGVTNDLRRRLYEHKNKLIPGFTSTYNVDKLVYYAYTSNINEAIAFEKKIKGWRRSKKDALIEEMNPEWKELKID